MTSKPKRKTSRMGPTSSRSSSAIRRAPIAAVSATVSAADAAVIGKLVTHILAKARGEPKAPDRLRSYAWTVRQGGRGQLMALVQDALTFDGGRFLRYAAGDLSPQDAVDVAVAFVRVAIERGVSDGAALALLLRASIEARLHDDALLRLVAGKGSADDERRIARLNGAARLDMAEALRHAEAARALERGGHVVDEHALRRLRDRQRERATAALEAPEPSANQTGLTADSIESTSPANVPIPAPRPDPLALAERPAEARHAAARAITVPILGD